MLRTVNIGFKCRIIVINQSFITAKMGEKDDIVALRIQSLRLLGMCMKIDDVGHICCYFYENSRTYGYDTYSEF